MKPRRNLKGLGAFCAEVHEDDGIDPREASCRRGSGEHSKRKGNRKDLQLAKQVFRAIDTALRGELNDSVLHDVEVVSVEPAPDSTHFVVILRPTVLGGRVSASAVLERLSRARRFLRYEVASAITRKRVPELSFEVIEGEGECP